MTEWNNPTELGETTSTSKPCDHCPMITWGYLHDPANIEFEKQIRADERMATGRLVNRLSARVEQLEAENRTLKQQAKKAS